MSGRAIVGIFGFAVCYTPKFDNIVPFRLLRSTNALAFGRTPQLEARRTGRAQSRLIDSKRVVRLLGARLHHRPLGGRHRPSRTLPTSI